MAEMVQHGHDCRGLRFELFLQNDVAISVDDADADGVERYVEAGEVLHNPLPMKLCGQTLRDTPLACSPAYSISAGSGSMARCRTTRPSQRTGTAVSARATCCARCSRRPCGAAWPKDWSAARGS